MPEKAVQQAFANLMEAAPVAVQEELQGLANALPAGEAVIIDVPVKALPYDALRSSVIHREPAVLAAERHRRQQKVQRELAEASLWDIAV